MVLVSSYLEVMSKQKYFEIEIDVGVDRRFISFLNYLLRYSER